MHYLFGVITKQMLSAKCIQPGTVLKEIPWIRLIFGSRPATRTIVHAVLLLLPLVSFVSLQSCVPVVTKLGPIVVRLTLRIANKGNPLDLFVAVFQGHQQTQWGAMILRQRCAHHLGDKQGLWMTADVKIIACVIVPVRSFHIDILGFFAVDECRRISAGG